MSMRSLIELNHDLGPIGPDAIRQCGESFARYMRSADPRNLPPCACAVDLRHHSEKVVAARAGHTPSQDEIDIEEIAKIIARSPYPSQGSINKARKIFEFLTKAKEPRS